jgi:repressor LexA
MSIQRQQPTTHNKTNQADTFSFALLARDGDIVVAMIDKVEATLKRFKRRGEDQIALIPENSAMEPMIYHAERVSIHGVLVGQLRNYR